MHTIRRMNPGEAALYRTVRLEALKDAPEAFATSYESALARDDASWAAQADASAEGGDRATFIVMADGPAGLAAVYRDAGGAASGELLQMWISPELRGTSAAADLLDHLFAWAAGQGITSIRGEVTAGNERALRFYVKYGFRVVGSGSGGVVIGKEITGIEE